MKNCILFFSLLMQFYACARLDLVPATADTIMADVQQNKGTNAVLLNIWATSCAPCVAEFPAIVEMGDSNSKLYVLFVSTDFLEHENKVIQFLRQHGVTGKSFIKNQKDQAFINGFHPDWSGALPFTILFAKNSGNVVDYWEGSQPEIRFKTAIERAVKI